MITKEAIEAGVAAFESAFNGSPNSTEMVTTILTASLAAMPATDLQAENDRLRAALLECDEYFDNRADADCDQDGYIPNAEMKMLTIVRAALERT